jgi:integrase
MINHRDKLPRQRHKHGAWYYDHGYNDAGKRVWEWLSRDMGDAKIKWATIEASGIVPQDGTFSAASQNYQTTAMAHLSAAEQKNRKRYLDDADKTFGHMLIKSIQTHHIQSAYNLIGKKNTAQKFVTAISTVFTHAISTGLGGIRDNPCRYVKTAKIAPRDRCPSIAEFLAVHAIAPPMLAEAMIWVLLTGWDLGQIIHLRKDQISDDGIRYKRRKTQKQPRAQLRLIEWNPHLRACYDRVLALHPHRFCQYVFVKTGGEKEDRGQPYNEHGLKSIWQVTIRRALREGRLTDRYQFRDLRALAATIADSQGNDAQALLAHLTARQTLDYIRAKTPKRVQANSLPAGVFVDTVDK